ncbi:unnamed protein product [Echinostoma caproni]|uniref:FAM192A_Fyv6_N domain-containing protein n=1 Tax=Echinostoma caproni TaxID=27848 RepID=A0A183BFQ6_9TREM|nr:unnamed protein product [Echinostoma caproni]
MSSKSAIKQNERMVSSVVARKSATTDAEDDIFMDKEELLKENDFHAYNIEVLKQERNEILEIFSEQKKSLPSVNVIRLILLVCFYIVALWEQLEQEQKTLDKCREELFQMRELKVNHVIVCFLCIEPESICFFFACFRILFFIRSSLMQFV